MERAGRIVDWDWSRYDFRHVVFQPALMSREKLQAGADWLYSRFYRLDQILWRFMRNVVAFRWMAAILGLKLGLTYRYDNRREWIIGRNPAPAGRLGVRQFTAAFNFITGDSHTAQGASNLDHSKGFASDN